MILPGQLPLFELITSKLEVAPMENKELPGIEECLAYAGVVMKASLAKRAPNIPSEIKEDIAQEFALWMVGAYKDFNPELNWRGYIATRAVGLIKDMQKLHRTFPREMKRQRLVETEEGLVNDLDLILQLEGMSSSHELRRPINLDMLARLAVDDIELHAFVRYEIYDQTINEIARPFGVTPQMVDLYIKAFLNRFTQPRHRWDSRPDFLQALYAMGISEHFDIPFRDQSELQRFRIGHGDAKVDFTNFDPPHRPSLAQMSFSFESESA